MWGPARVSGQGRERYFLLVVDDYTLYSTVFPLHSKGEVPDFSYNLLWDFCCGEGILHSFTLPASPQQNGIADRRIGLVMEVARTSMIHAAAPHFLWPFAVRYAAHQVNLLPRVSLLETSPTLSWTGKVDDASVFRVWGSRAFVRDTFADKLSSRAIPCVFLGFPPDAPGWQFYHPTLRRVLPSHDVTFDMSVPFYRLFPYRSDPLPPPPLFLAPGPPPGAASGGAGPASAEPWGAEPAGAEPGGAESEGPRFGGAEPGGAEPGGTESEGAESGGAEPRGTASVGGPAGASPRLEALPLESLELEVLELIVLEVLEFLLELEVLEVLVLLVLEVLVLEVLELPGLALLEALEVEELELETLALEALELEALELEALALVALELEELELETMALEALELEAFKLEALELLTLELQTDSFTERRKPESRPASLVCTGHRVPRPRPPPVPGMHVMALRPSSVPPRVSLLHPPESSLPVVPDLESDLPRAVSPTDSRLLAAVVTDPSFESIAASALVAELVDFVAASRLDYATALVAESESPSPPSVGGECALGTDVLEDKQDDFECLEVALLHLVAMLLAPEGDPDAPDIPTTHSYADAITGPYSFQWQTAMDAEMASWKSTGTYVDAVPPSGANIVDGMWIFKVKRPPGSLPVFKARYVARGFSQRQGVDFFHTFSPTLKMTTLWVLLYVAAQCDYELNSLYFSTAFLQGSLHEECYRLRTESMKIRG
ncbi:unnamed protein product [Closterium sp. NIES-54]